MPKTEELDLVLFGQATGDMAIERLVAEYNLALHEEGFAWPGIGCGPSWDSPMFVLYDKADPENPKPVGFLAFIPTKWTKQISIEGFYIQPAYRGFNFIRLLQGLKAHILKVYPTVRYIVWGTHWKNNRVQKICERVGMEPYSLSYSMDLSTGSPDDPRVTSKCQSITG